MGGDAGSSGYNLKEKDVVLDIALAIKDHFTKNYKGVIVRLSSYVWYIYRVGK